MIKITSNSGSLDQLRQSLAGFSDRRFAAAVATGLTRTAVKVRTAVREELVRSIDRPSPYTLRGLYMRPATAARLEARVWFGDEYRDGTPQGRYLSPQVHGGTRGTKRFEKALQLRGSMPAGWHAVPGPGARLDAYGNVQRGQLQQILSQVGTELTAGYVRTLSRIKSRRRRAFGRAGGQYVAFPKQTGKLRPGIYLATGKDFGARVGYGRTGALVPVLFFRPATVYRKRYDFYGVADRVTRETLPAELDRAIEESAARLAARGRA